MTARGRTRGGRRLRGYLFVLPALAVYLAFAVLPALHTAYLSLFDWDGVTLGSWAGLDNYRRVFTDPALRGSVVNALVLVVFFALLPILAGLLLTALLARHRRPGMAGYRLLFMLPQVVPLVAVGVTWRWLYGEDGLVNEALDAVGLGGFTRAWLGDFDWALIAVGLVGTWVLSGLCMMLFLSGVHKVDPQLYEAARLDGAGPVREFVSVTLPQLRGELAVALTVTTVAALASFDIVYVTTGGGPGEETTVPGLLIYRLAFSAGKVGLASALGVVLSLLILVIVYLVNRLSRTPS
ncbi:MULTISPECIES: carbohydrate ABC transporter permease [Streptomyces]|uniref:ABC transporter permease n=1 Tax=Streptomyces cacaoi TaxID=1898 RepID=A0A4Y3R0S0_STRCI|nr:MULTISPECIES: sugar ABC transporter permease [Streptomyces]NNG88270.1 sugar ABC transporter permease [Streptomyces cacaoi]QHF94292.1 sugar ABC transporter permease [Streptomyces sp. NHF165]GEB51286.1 ABC transporter permease [Streptomyces cacaoi]